MLLHKKSKTCGTNSKTGWQIDFKETADEILKENEENCIRS